jgi:hypothetical protein
VDLSSEFNNKNTVLVVVAYNRPKYLKRVLESLENCVGVEMYDVYFSVDPGNKEVLRLAWGFDASRSRTVTRNEVRLGAHENKKRALDRGFQVADFVIMIEDDTILSPDTLQFFEYARDRYEFDDNVFTISAYGDNCRNDNTETVPSKYYHTIARRHHYTPWVWGTWKDRWVSDIKDQWNGWDVQMNFRTPPYEDMVSGRNKDGPDFSRFDAGIRRDRVEVFPVLSRSNNIGDENGMHNDYGISNFLYQDATELNVLSTTTAIFTENFDRDSVRELCNHVPFGSDTLRSMCRRD